MTEPVEGGASAISIAFFVAAPMAKSLPLDLPLGGPGSLKKRCIPNIITHVLHLNLNLTIKRSGYDNFLICHIGPHFSRFVGR
jgi:hypothetical protein